MLKLTKLFEPVKIGSLELPNRIVMTAATVKYHQQNNDRFANFYVERIRGGASMVIIGNMVAIYPSTRGDFSLANSITSDKDIPRMQSWTKAIHQNGGKIAAMLSAYGYWAKGGEGTPAEDVSPSGIVQHGKEIKEDHPENYPSRPLTVEEIHLIEEQLADAALRAVKADFDAVEIQVIAGNLLNRFLSTATNERTDQYGGNLQNRARMLLETIALTKKKVGNDYPLICRIAGDDFVPGGLTLDNYKEIAPLLEKAGIHAINFMVGWHTSRKPTDQMCVPPGAFVYLAEGIKQVVKIPVIANKQIFDPVMAERILAEGKADIIGLCRPLIADPEWPKKAREGRLDDIRYCTHCDECFDSPPTGSVACSVNARAGREEISITPSPKPKKVFVIGGGPAGMEAARVAALRGHKVTLFEKKKKLGGQLLYAVLPPYKEGWHRFIDYLMTQLGKLSVELKLNQAGTVDSIEEGKPDVVIVATGAEPIIPKIPGVRSKNVDTAIDVLTGKKETGRNVVIIGGGATGCETAEFLARLAKRVTILEMKDVIGEDFTARNRIAIMDRLGDLGVAMETGAKVEEITKTGVSVARKDGTSQLFEAESVVLAAGMKPTGELYEALKGKVPEIKNICDCIHRVRDATSAGFKAGLEI